MIFIIIGLNSDQNAPLIIDYMSFQVRIAKTQDFKVIRKWMDQQQWNPGIYDHLAYETAIDPTGFFVGTLDGQVIASVSAVKWSQQFCFIGLYIVDLKYRGKGYGLKVWNHALETVKNHNIGLDGVLQQQKNYSKSGFKGYYRHVRYDTFGHENFYMHQSVKFASDLQFENILRYDQGCFPAKRPEFLKIWINLPESRTFLYQDKQKSENNTIKGYVVMRKSSEGIRIGPLFADNSQIAQELLKTCFGHTPKDTKIFIDVPDNNEAATQLVKKYKMQAGFTCVRMYTKGLPKNINQSAIYGVTTLQFG